MKLPVVDIILRKVEKFLRDQNDQTERKKETEKSRREERLVSASLLSFREVKVDRYILIK